MMFFLHNLKVLKTWTGTEMQCGFWFQFNIQQKYRFHSDFTPWLKKFLINAQKNIIDTFKLFILKYICMNKYNMSEK